MTLGIVLLLGPRREVFLMNEAPCTRHVQYRISGDGRDIFVGFWRVSWARIQQLTQELLFVAFRAVREVLGHFQLSCVQRI